MTFDDWRETYSPHGMMNEAMARAAWDAAYSQGLQVRESQAEAALAQWHEKTDWVRSDAKPGELGMHIADVLKKRIENFQAKTLQHTPEYAGVTMWCGDWIVTRTLSESGINHTTSVTRVLKSTSEACFLDLIDKLVKA